MARKNEMRTNGTQVYRESRNADGEWARVKAGGVLVTRTETKDSTRPGCLYRVTFIVQGSYQQVKDYVSQCLPTVPGMPVPTDPAFIDGEFRGEWHY